MCKKLENEVLRVKFLLLRLQSTHSRFSSTSLGTCEKNLHQMLARAVGSGGAERRRRLTARALNAKLQKIFTQNGKNFILTGKGTNCLVAFLLKLSGL